jgi:cobalt-precorrin-5B (C1)-methyltransferase
MLKYLRDHPVAKVTIAGGIGKMTKLAQGLLDLHSKRGAVDLAALAAAAADAGGTQALAERIRAANTTAHAFTLAAEENVALGDAIARAARRTAARTVEGVPIALEILIFDREGGLVGRAPFAPVHDEPPRNRRR